MRRPYEERSVGKFSEHRKSLRDAGDLEIVEKFEVEMRNRKIPASYFDVRELDLIPPCSLIVIDGLCGGVAWVAPLTPDPSANTAKKLYLRFDAKSDGLGQWVSFYQQQFGALWARGRPIARTEPERRTRVRAEIAAHTHKLRSLELEHALDERKDIAIVIALSEEFDQFKHALGDVPLTADKDNHLSFDFAEYKCVALLMGKMGRSIAAQLTERLVAAHGPKLVVSMGLAGSLSKDVGLGDVVVASQVDDYGHRSKVIDSDGTFELRLGGSVFATSFDVQRKVLHMPYSHPKPFEDWVKGCKESARELGLQALAETGPKLVSDDAHVASGDAVVDAQDYHRLLKQRDRNLVAVEMESAGVAQAIHAHAEVSECLVIRCISDKAADKETLDHASCGNIRKVAMRNATRLASAPVTRLTAGARW